MSLQYIISETNHIDTFTVLWYTEITAVKYLGEHCVSKFFHCTLNNLKGTAFIMLHKVFDILHKHHLRIMVFYNASNVKKQSTTGVIKSKTFSAD